MAYVCGTLADHIHSQKEAPLSGASHTRHAEPWTPCSLHFIPITPIALSTLAPHIQQPGSPSLAEASSHPDLLII